MSTKAVTKRDVRQPQISNKRVIVWGLALTIGAFLSLQVLPLTTDYENPPVLTQMVWDSSRTRDLVIRACRDCHSNETHWPWYSYIAPMSEVVRKDVLRGREALNFSEWGHGGALEIEEITETISKHQMPLRYYSLINRDAILTDAERGALIHGLIATVRQDALQAEELDASSPEETGGPPSQNDDD